MSITHNDSFATMTLNAAEPGWKGWLVQRLAELNAWRKRRRQRRIDWLAFQQMLYLNDHLLRDIGHQRADLEDANNLPLNVDAAQAARMIRQQRRSVHGVHRVRGSS